jgi:hypothetical protein
LDDTSTAQSASVHCPVRIRRTKSSEAAPSFADRAVGPDFDPRIQHHNDGLNVVPVFVQHDDIAEDGSG